MKMMGEQDRAFFEPFWRRIAMLAVLVAWLAWEWSNGETFWATLVGGGTAYFVWAYFIAFPRSTTPDAGSDKIPPA
jgi:hypothetical protein